jgi:small subunit ribosomal protein S4
MGDPKRLRKKFQTPSHPFQKARIEEENRIRESYGLKTKTEIWKAQSKVRRYRAIARGLQGDRSAHRAKKVEELITKLAALGLVRAGAGLDDVLGLKVTDMLERRLQTLVYKKGLALSPKQARQFITHGLIAISGRRVNVPGYTVETGEQEKIAFYGQAPQLQKPAREKPAPAGVAA